MGTTNHLLDDAAVIERIFDHIDHETTDLGETTWREPVENYRSRGALRRRARRGAAPAAGGVLPVGGASPSRARYVARDAAGTPILAVRGNDGRGARVPQRLPPPRRASSRRARAARRRSSAAITAGPTASTDACATCPHEHGFPGLDKATRGLVPLETVGGRRGSSSSRRSAPGSRRVAWKTCRR